MNDALVSAPKQVSILAEAQKLASNCGLDITKLEALLQAIELNRRC